MEKSTCEKLGVASVEWQIQAYWTNRGLSLTRGDLRYLLTSLAQYTSSPEKKEAYQGLYEVLDKLQ